jgi:hypothetical protein
MSARLIYRQGQNGAAVISGGDRMQTTRGGGPRGARRSASFQWQLEVLGVPPLSRAGERRQGVLPRCDVRNRGGR